MNMGKLSLAMGLLSLSLSQQAFADVSGVVYRDLPVNGSTLNTYGVKDANELGVAGIDVTVTGTTGSGTATTTADGSWSVVGSLGDVRVEFSSIPSYLESSPVNSGSNTTVQFILDGTTADLGLHNPSDYSSTTEPRVAVPIYRNGNGLNYSKEGLISIQIDATGLNGDYTHASGNPPAGPVPSYDATIHEVGSIWASIWQANKSRLFNTTFLKRHVGIRDGLGYVYVTEYNAASGSLVHKFDLEGISTTNGGTIQFGSVCREASCGTASDYVLPNFQAAPNVDLDSFGKVGKIGMGGADLQEDKPLLWIVNLNQKALIKVDVSGESNTLPSTVDQYLLSNLSGLPNCTGGELRPWALKFSDGKGYLGAVCDAATSQNPADVESYVLSFDPNNITAGFSQEVKIEMDYRRETWTDDIKFTYWLDDYSEPPVYEQFSTITLWPQPILSDIEFSADGDMFLAIMDRFTHQFGHQNYKPLPGNTDASDRTPSFGEVLKVCRSNNTWAVEGSATCPVTDGYNGPGGNPSGNGEYFYDTPGDSNDAESSNGSWALLKGSGTILMSMYDPNPEQRSSDYLNTQGWNTLDLDTGGVTRWYSENYGDIETFGKANGMGDMELLTSPAPLEIGNRVWDDVNGNGIQDAGEAGIDGVVVTLNCGGGDFTQTTANGGQYLFTDANVAGGIPRDTSCTISVPTTTSGQVLTLRNSSTNEPLGSNPDTTTGSFTFTTGSAGQNNHTYDIGYRTTPTGGSITIIKEATPNDPQDFAFTATGTGVSNFTLDDDSDGTLSNTQTFTDLADGSFTIAETAVTDWTLTGISCTGATNSSITKNTTSVDIVLNNAEDITCTFYNNNHSCPAGQILNTVTASANESETTYANNSDAACLEVADSCSLTASAVVSACTNVGSDADASNDTFTFDLTVQGNNTNGSTSYNYTSSSANISGSGSYSATAETDGAFTIANTNSPFDLTITDAIDNTCSVSVTGLVAPAACSNTPQVDLELTKTASPTSVVSGDTLTYTLTVRNTSSTDATGVVISDPLPVGITYVSDDGGAATTESAGTVTWNLGNLAASASATLNITVTVD